MSIAGVDFYQDGQKTLCLVHDLTEELKQIIRDELTGIFHGRYAAGKSSVELYSYTRTLKNLLSRYDTKTKNIKKGMMGELIAHILLSRAIPDIECISIYKNKEERSIKKGFDLIFKETIAAKKKKDQKVRFWYTEVKAGENNKKSAVAKANNILLGRARKSIYDLLLEERDVLWDSALTDITQMLPPSKSTSVQSMLSNEFIDIEKKSTKKNNVILVSVLYGSKNKKLSLIDLKKFTDSTIKAKVFENFIVCSIQKETYKKIADFLKSEAIS